MRRMTLKCLYSVLLLVAIGFSACKNESKSNDRHDNIVLVETQKVSTSLVDNQISVSGNIEGNKTVKLGFLVAGKLNCISKSEGESIKTGQLLASLDPENYKIAKDIADANVDQVKDEYDRLNVMYERNSLSKSDFSKVTNGLKQAKAQQRLQAKNLSDTKLFSPINGVLLKKGAEVGEIIGVGLPLFVVSDIHVVKVNAAVPESDLREIHIGNQAEVYISSLDDNFRSKITEIGSMAEPTTRTFTVKVELENPKMLIRPGMTAEIKFDGSKKSESIVIPTSAVLHDVDNSTYVFVANLKTNQAFKRKISIGSIIGDNVEVLSGIVTNESLIVSGQYKLSNGCTIQVK